MKGRKKKITQIMKLVWIYVHSNAFNIKNGYANHSRKGVYEYLRHSNEVYLLKIAHCNIKYKYSSLRRSKYSTWSPRTRIPSIQIRQHVFFGSILKQLLSKKKSIICLICLSSSLLKNQKLINTTSFECDAQMVNSSHIKWYVIYY